MARAYIPRAQDTLLAFALNAANQLSAQPFRYGVTPDDAAHFQSYVDDFAAQMALVSNPLTNTMPTVQAKEESRLRMLYIIRPILQNIKTNMGVSDGDKVGLGLNLGGATHARVPAPCTAPRLTIVAATPLQHTLRYQDAATATRSGKPAGVNALELLCQIGAAPLVALEYARSMGLFTRALYVVTFTAADVGKTAHYWGRWLTRRGLPGPWSQSVSMTIAG